MGWRELFRNLSTALTPQFGDKPQCVWLSPLGSRPHGQRQCTKNSLLDVELKPKSHWSVRLGAQEWAKYTYERPPEDPLQLLGSARRGMQSGALAKLGDGFVLVVGDHLTPLSHTDNKQLAKATAHVRTVKPVFLFKAAPVSAAPPVVVVKRRRIPVNHD